MRDYKNVTEHPAPSVLSDFVYGFLFFAAAILFYIMTPPY